MEAALQVLSKFRRLAESHQVDRIEAVATSAVREAENGGEFLKAIFEQTGIPRENLRFCKNRKDKAPILAISDPITEIDWNSNVPRCGFYLGTIGTGRAAFWQDNALLLDGLEALELHGHVVGRRFRRRRSRRRRRERTSYMLPP